MKLKDFIQELIEKGYRQKDIAQMCGYSDQFINQLLRKIENPSIATISRFATSFNKPISFFMDNDDKEGGEILSKEQQQLIDLIGDDKELLREVIKHAEKEKLYKEVKKTNVA